MPPTSPLLVQILSYHMSKADRGPKSAGSKPRRLCGLISGHTWHSYEHVVHLSDLDSHTLTSLKAIQSI